MSCLITLKNLLTDKSMRFYLIFLLYEGALPPLNPLFPLHLLPFLYFRSQIQFEYLLSYPHKQFTLSPLTLSYLKHLSFSHAFLYKISHLSKIIPVQNKFLYTWRSEVYDAISGAKAADNLKEAEDEARKSRLPILKTNMESHKGLPMHEDNSWAKKSCHIPA